MWVEPFGIVIRSSYFLARLARVQANNDMGSALTVRIVFPTRVSFRSTGSFKKVEQNPYRFKRSEISDGGAQRKHAYRSGNKLRELQPRECIVVGPEQAIVTNVGIDVG